jgi:hypothetical protein
VWWRGVSGVGGRSPSAKDMGELSDCGLACPPGTEACLTVSLYLPDTGKKSTGREDA